MTIETTGRVTGRPIRVAVGYIDDGERVLRVAAGDPDADWARNLEADPRCRVTLGEETWAAEAASLDAREAARTVTDLILRYGTPAEKLGRGPAFRLRPVGHAGGQGR